MNILFVAEAFDSKKVEEYLQMPFLQFISTCFSIEVTHFRTLVSKIDTNSNNIIILHFNRQNIPLFKKLIEIKSKHMILILYFHADFKSIYNCISDNRNILEDIAQFDILATMHYRLSYQLKDLFKKNIFELLPHQNYYWKKKLFLNQLQSIYPHHEFEDAIRSLSEHEIINYMDHIIHVSGKKKTEYKIDEFIVVCVVKNGESYIREFISYYMQLGAKHIFFLDNGSSDNTISICKEYSYVSLYVTTLRFREFENQMKDAFIKYLCNNNWCLYVDIDELFDFPFSDKINMKNLLHYLNIYKYSAVLLNMLLLYPDKEIFQKKIDTSFTEKFCYFDYCNIEKVDYGNNLKLYNLHLSNNNLKLHLRKRLDNFSLALYKHSLFFVHQNMKLFPNPHICQNATIADFTCILKHYKEYDSYYENRFSEESKKFEDLYQLIDDQFIIISSQYRDFVDGIK